MDLRAQAARLAASALRDSSLVVNVGLGTTTQTTKLGMPGGWTETKVRQFSVEAVEDVVQRQMALDNFPEAIFYDGSLAGSPFKFRREIYVPFQGGINARPIMEAVEAQAATRIPGTTFRWVAKATTPAAQARLQKMVNRAGPVPLKADEWLLYAPVMMSSNPDSTYQNILDISGRKRRAKPTKSGKPSRRAGNFGLAARSVRQGAKAKGFYVKAYHTFRPDSIRGRKLPPGVSVKDRVTNARGGTSFYQGAWGFQIRLSIGSRRSGR